MTGGRAAILAFLLLAPTASTPVQEWSVGSTWRFTLVDTDKDRPVQLTFLVSAAPAHSCQGGDWKQLELVGGKYANLSAPAWMIVDGELKVLLASDICDAYDEIGGKLSGRSFVGQHYLFGLGGSDPLGKATAIKLR